MGLILIILAGAAIWWLKKRPDLDAGYGILIFGIAWMAGLTGIYWTMKECWL